MNDKIKVIKVYDYDYNDFEYENIFLVNCNDNQEKELYSFMEEIRQLDINERVKKYNEESSIVLVENYINNNFQVLDYELININCYEL